MAPPQRHYLCSFKSDAGQEAAIVPKLQSHFYLRLGKSFELTELLCKR